MWVKRKRKGRMRRISSEKNVEGGREIYREEKDYEQNVEEKMHSQLGIKRIERKEERGRRTTSKRIKEKKLS
jgi:hypothetical protein